MPHVAPKAPDASVPATPLTPRAGAGAGGADLLAALAPAVFLVLWALGFVVAKIGLAHADPLSFLAIRYLILVAVLVPVVAVLRPPMPRGARAWGHIAMVGFLIQVVYFGAAYAGMAMGVSAGVAAVIGSTQPLAVALAAPALTGERIAARGWLGLALGAGGSLAVVLSGRGLDAAPPVAVLACVVSMLGMAAATLWQRRFAVPAHPLWVNLIHFGLGSAVIGPAALAGPLQVDWTPGFWGAVLWVSITNSLVSISILLFLLKRSEAARVSALFYLVPPLAAVIGWAALGESLALAGWAGIAVAAAGVWLVSARR
ncbi:DMT family transporter [Frigidibacter sp. MR17.14]|uniref:DMT family transporter n=1 Tax=Frigidibacter sp. MR17.14 TaxID=3126509 RepID=UPI003012A44E